MSGKTELLKAVAECAPKEMYLSFDPAFPALGFCLGYGGRETFRVIQGTRHTLENDNQDARLIIAMLDAMEKDGHSYSLYRVSGGQYYCDSTCSARVRAKGTTRAEAVARAFVAVFGEVNSFPEYSR